MDIFVLVLVFVCGAFAQTSDYIIEPFKIGSIEGGIVRFVLDFGDVGRAYNSFPVSDLHSISNGNTTFYEYLYTHGMTDLVPVYFQLDQTGTSVGVLSMWNSNVSYCYQNYQTNQDSSVFLGQTCLDRHVFGGTIDTYGPFQTREQMGIKLHEIVTSTNKTAVEFNPAVSTLKFRVFSDLPNADNLSTLTLPIILVVFLMAWLGWTKEISLIVKTNQDQSIVVETWLNVCDKYAVFIIDVISICLSTSTVSVFNEFSMLQGGDAIQLAGESNAKFILNYCWAGAGYVFASWAFIIIAYGFSKTVRGQQYIQKYSRPITGIEWFIAMGKVLVIMAVGSGVVYGVCKWANLFDKTVIYVVVAIAGGIFPVALFYYDRVLVLVDQFDWNHRSVQFLLCFRWGIEFIVLTTMHSSLPTSINGDISTQYRNGVGFAIGAVLCMITGRDVTWIVRRDLNISTQLPDFGAGIDFIVQALFFILYCLLVLCVIAYSSVFLIGPVFITSTQLEQESEIALCVAASIAVQCFAGGSIFAASHINTKAQ